MRQVPSPREIAAPASQREAVAAGSAEGAALVGREAVAEETAADLSAKPAADVVSESAAEDVLSATADSAPPVRTDADPAAHSAFSGAAAAPNPGGNFSTTAGSAHQLPIDANPAAPSTFSGAAGAPSLGGGNENSGSNGTEETLTAGAADAALDDGSPPFSLRVQGTLRGAIETRTVENLHGYMTVVDLEDRIAEAFGTGDGVRLRLFFMGRELKEADVRLAAVGLKSGATLNIMFVPGSVRRRPATAATAAPAAPGGAPSSPSGTAAGATAEAVPLPTTSGVTAEALPLPTIGGTALGLGPHPQGVAAAPPVSPAEAWQAVAELEVQLARGSDPTEEPMAQQAAMVLRQMLSTLAHDANPALVQMAQLMVPDFSKIWNFEPTRDHLTRLLAPPEAAEGSNGAGSASSSAGAQQH